MIVTWLDSFTVVGNTQFEYGATLDVPSDVIPWLLAQPTHKYTVQEDLEDGDFDPEN